MVPERLATGRAAAGPPPADVGESASLSPVDEPADARPADSDGQPAVDRLGTHVVKINRDEM